jgi:hypothetical protein
MFRQIETRGLFGAPMASYDPCHTFRREMVLTYVAITEAEKTRWVQ